MAQMTADNIEILADGIRRVYSSHPSQARDLVEGFLEGELAGKRPADRLSVLKDLMREFEKKNAPDNEEIRVDQAILTRIFSFLLGKKVTTEDMSSSELLNRLADSLNTVFDSLNQLVGVINSTFLGQQNGLQTIRQVIGFRLEGEDRSSSLETYLGQISKAFLTAQKAFRTAAETKILEILDEMDPERLKEAVDGSFKFGSFRKAETFDLYAERYEALKKWVESGRFMEELMREFEKNSQKLFLK